MKAAPKMRRDRTCALKGCTDALPALAVEHRDPFHSAACSRKYYGVTYLMDTEREMARRPSEASKKYIGGRHARAS